MQSDAPSRYVLGVDVGTQSARAGVFDGEGKQLSTAAAALALYKPEGFSGYFQQSSRQIWAAVCEATKAAIARSGVNRHHIEAIAFDAACSLVLVKNDFSPVSVCPLGEEDQNVIVWLDHRAVREAEDVNATQHWCLASVGGKVSPEMEIPKLMWLKKNMPQAVAQAEHIMDLADFLSYRATGDNTRSTCTMVCKWNYHRDPSRQTQITQTDSLAARAPDGIPDDFLRMLNLETFVSSGPDHNKIMGPVRIPGTPVGAGMSSTAAAELGLVAGTIVSVSLIDAHAGGVGVLACELRHDMHLPPEPHSGTLFSHPFEKRVAVIAGTSTCLMASSAVPVFVPGVWGPYVDAMVPRMVLHEGGQSAAGALLSHLIQGHSAWSQAQEQAQAQTHSGRTPWDVLADRIEALARKRSLPPSMSALLTADLHVYPDFAGNRSPLAEPGMRGGIVGLSLSDGLDELAMLYLATIQALAYSTRHILEEIEAARRAHTQQEQQCTLTTLVVCGGLSQSQLYVHELTNALGVDVIVPTCDGMLAGCAILAATACGIYQSVERGMLAMTQRGSLLSPMQCDEAQALRAYHDAKYMVYQRMLADQLEYRSIMARSTHES